jgi:hypothetical protein
MLLQAFKRKKALNLGVLAKLINLNKELNYKDLNYQRKMINNKKPSKKIS